MQLSVVWFSADSSDLTVSEQVQSDDGSEMPRLLTGIMPSLQRFAGIFQLSRKTPILNGW